MTTHVYDYKTRKWVPYVADVNKYKTYFVAMSEGRVKPGRHIIKPPKTAPEEPLKIVSPTAQALEMAKETVKTKRRRYEDAFSYKK